MKAVILTLFISVLLTNCNASYYGYVYDFDKKIPLENVIINDYLNNNKTSTNSEGYFSLRYDNNGSSGILIFSKDGYTTDSIRAIQIQSGEYIKEKFKGERIYLFNIKNTFRDSIAKINQSEY